MTRSETEHAMLSRTRRRFLRDILAAVLGATVLPVGRLTTNQTAATHALCLGYICRVRGEAAQALAYFNEAIRLHGGLALAYTEKAVLHDELGHHQQATVDYQRGFELLKKISQEGGERRKEVMLHSRQIARALAELVRDDPSDPYKLYALECWLRDYDLGFVASLH
jgi:tetratricopeptide (TPR) repeat protein